MEGDSIWGMMEFIVTGSGCRPVVLETSFSQLVSWFGPVIKFDPLMSELNDFQNIIGLQ